MTTKLRSKEIHNGRIVRLLVGGGVVYTPLLLGLLALAGDRLSELGVLALVGATMALLIVATLRLLPRVAVFDAEYELTGAGLRATVQRAGAAAPTVRELPWTGVRDYVIKTEPLGGQRYLLVRAADGRKSMRIYADRGDAGAVEFRAFCDAFVARAAPGAAGRIPEGRSWFDSPAAKAIAAAAVLAVAAMGAWAFFLAPAGEVSSFQRLRLAWVALLLAPFVARVLFPGRKPSA